MSFSALWQQFPPPSPPGPTFTEKDVEPRSQAGEVFTVTGAHSGIGLALLKILYPTGATVYLAGHSPFKTNKAVRAIAAA